MFFSLLLCTLNRESVLEKCIQSLMQQSYKKFEIIIIDQSDTKNKKYIIQKNTIIKYKHITKRGLSNARNIALSIAKGDYICLVDDDATYDRNWLYKLKTTIEQYPAYDVIIGRVQDPRTKKFALNANRDKIKANLGYFDVMKYGLSAACFIKRKWFGRILFDDRFGVGRKWGAGEETDVLWKILESGGNILYAPDIVVFHPVVEKSDVNLEKIVSYNRGFGALFAKHFNKKIDIKIFTLYSLLKNLIGMTFYCFLLDFRKIKLQKESLKNKLKGIKEYVSE